MHTANFNLRNSRWPELAPELHDEVLKQLDSVSDMVNWCRAFDGQRLFSRRDVEAEVRRHGGWSKVERRARAAAARPSQQDVADANRRMFADATPGLVWRARLYFPYPRDVLWLMGLFQHANKWVPRVAWKKVNQAQGILRANWTLSPESASLSPAAK